jgi:hypothetical protein
MVQVESKGEGNDPKGWGDHIPPPATIVVAWATPRTEKKARGGATVAGAVARGPQTRAHASQQWWCPPQSSWHSPIDRQQRQRWTTTTLHQGKPEHYRHGNAPPGDAGAINHRGTVSSCGFACPPCVRYRSAGRKLYTSTAWAQTKLGYTCSTT